MSGEGYLSGDAALTVLLVIASASSWWNIAYRGHSIGGWLLALGFTTFAVRMVAGYLTGNDPLIPPVSLIAISLISSGWSVVALRKRPRLLGR